VTNTANTLPTLREVSAMLLTTGAQDIAENFSQFLETDKTLGPKCNEPKLAKVGLLPYSGSRINTLR
jgi:hypothetical protein